MTGQPDGAPHVVVLGGGLAGVACAHRLGDEGVSVTLVDRHDYQQFQPLLYQVATSQLPAEDIARPHRTIFREHPTVERPDRRGHGGRPRGQERVLGRRRGRQRVAPRDRGGRPAPVLRRARCRRARVPALLRRRRRAAAAALPRALRAGGQDEPSARRRPRRRRRGRRPDRCRGGRCLRRADPRPGGAGRHPPAGTDRPGRPGSALLGAFSEKSHEYAHERLTKEGAEIRLGAGVASVHPDRVELDDGSVIPTRTVIWGGGESAAPIAAGAGLPTGRGGRVDVRARPHGGRTPARVRRGRRGEHPVGGGRAGAAAARLGRPAVRPLGRGQHPA